jgi:hypothetical protein
MFDDQHQTQPRAGQCPAQAGKQREGVGLSISANSHRQHRELAAIRIGIGGLPNRQTRYDLVDVLDQFGRIKRCFCCHPHVRGGLQPMHEKQRRVLQGKRPVARQHDVLSLVNQ